MYFDHNASTPVAPEVITAYAAALRDFSGNASSVHRTGQLARQQLEAARLTIASTLGISAAELVFTGGGTEANNLAILGLVRDLPARPRHAITTQMEHPSVLEAFRLLEGEGVSVTYLDVPPAGVIELDKIARSIRPETVIVSVMHANNETGAIQPIAAIAELLRGHRASGQRIYLHSDGIQALGKLNVRLDLLGVDLYSVSAHKVYAPKGIGALFVRRSSPLRGIQVGGRHERERRAGTENVPGAMAFARAVELLSSGETQRTAILRDRFEQQVLSAAPDVSVNGSRESRLANTSNLLFPGVSGETLLIALDTCGFAVSTGSACSSGSIEPSHVLLAMGLNRGEARSSVRFSFGRFNTAEEVEQLSDAVVSAVGRLRRTRERKVQLAG